MSKIETIKLFKKYYKRLSYQGWIKSLICGFIIGGFIMLLAATALWLAGSKMFYLAFLALASGIATTPLFYKFIFKPTTKEIAIKIDELGLEERMITMAELEDDESYIAQKQREDAANSLKTISEKLLKIAISIPMALVLGVATVLGGGMTAVAALSGTGVIDSGTKIIEVIKNEQSPQYIIEYDVDGEGIIDGDIVQGLKPGENGSLVTAVPLDGFIFLQWSDGYNNPVRSEKNVQKDIHITAIFIELPEEDNNDGEQGDNGDGDQGDPDIPVEPDKGQGGNMEDGSSNSAGGSNNDETSKFGDGEKDYKDYWDEAKNDASKDTEGKDSDTKKTVDDYFNTIKSK